MAVHLLRRDPAGRRLRPGGRTGDEPGAPGVQERQGQDFTGEENKLCFFRKNFVGFFLKKYFRLWKLRIPGSSGKWTIKTAESSRKGRTIY